MDYLTLGIGLAIGTVVGHLLSRLFWRAAKTNVANGLAGGETQVASLADALAQTKAQVQSLDTQREGLRVERDQGRIDRAELQERCRGLVERQADLTNSGKEREQILSVTIAERDRLREHASGMQAELAGLKHQWEAQGSELESVTVKLTSVITERDSSKERSAALASSLEAIQREHGELRETYTGTRAALHDVEGRRGVLDSKAAALTQELESLKVSFVELSREVETVTTKLTSVTTERDAAKERSAALGSGLEAVQREHTELRETYAATKTALHNVENRRGELESKVAALTQELECLKVSFVELSREVETVSKKLTSVTTERDAAKERSAALGSGLEAVQREHIELRDTYAATKTALHNVENRRGELESKAAAMVQELESMKVSFDERMAEIKGAREQLVTTFKSTAAQVLQETKEQHAKEHRERLDTTLKPFQDQLKGFQELVSKTYSEEGRERVALKKEIEMLADRHQTLAKEAERLTNALSGSSKVRGDWGEITLKRILEKSGLREGNEFRIQESKTLEDGTRLRPDVVISLPEDGALVIDSKLQLIAWAKVSDAATMEDATIAKIELVAAIRSHMRDLNKKSYSDLYHTSVDMVIMYVPIDAAVLAALAESPDLYDEAFARGVVLTGPTMLMALLGSLAHQWRGKHQEQNVLKIAKMAESLGKKLEAFMHTYTSVGMRLRQGVQDFNKGLGQLATGSGNALKLASNLGEMGIKSAKRIGMNWEAITLDVDIDPALGIGFEGEAEGAEEGLE